MTDHPDTTPAPRPSRRRFLARLSTAPVAALGVHHLMLKPAPAKGEGITPTPHPDAELIALGQRWREASRAEKEADDRLEEAYARYDQPERPDAIRQRAGDNVGVGFGRTIIDGERWYSEAQVLLLKAERRAEWGDQVRADEIVAAWDRWEAECAARKDACGLTLAHAEARQAYEVERGICMVVLERPAHTLAGLRIKAEIALGYGEDLGWLGEITREGDREEQAAFSIVRDLLAMGTSA